MWFAILLIVLVAATLYEFRLRRPDQIILLETKGTIGFRRARLFPRHLSLAIPGTTHPIESRVEASAKGSIPVVVRIAASVAAAPGSIAALVRVGGWNTTAVAKAAKEFETALQGFVRAHSERCELEGLTAEGIHDALLREADWVRERFGLDLVTLTIQSVDPVDTSIAEALRQRESARLLEQTEVMNQQARVAAAQAKLHADEQITFFEHELELKRLDLKRSEQDREAQLANRRVEDELKRSRMRLEFDREEVGLLKENPQLLLLTPQAARLAEASQSLRNARTVVSLAPGDAEQGAKLLGLFQLFLENLLATPAKPGNAENR